MYFDAKQVVEQFHLVFLTLLGRALDKRLYAIKGGCNLRFYFKSFRSRLIIHCQFLLAIFQVKLYRSFLLNFKTSTETKQFGTTFNSVLLNICKS